MLLEEILSALAFAFLIGLGCVSNYLTHHISVQVLDEKSEVNGGRKIVLMDGP